MVGQNKESLKLLIWKYECSPQKFNMTSRPDWEPTCSWWLFIIMAMINSLFKISIALLGFLVADVEKSNCRTFPGWGFLQRDYGKCCLSFSKVCILFMDTKVGHLFHPPLHMAMTTGWFPAKGIWVEFIIDMFRPGTWNIFIFSSGVSLSFDQDKNVKVVLEATCIWQSNHHASFLNDHHEGVIPSEI